MLRQFAPSRLTPAGSSSSVPTPVSFRDTLVSTGVPTRVRVGRLTRYLSYRPSAHGSLRNPDLYPEDAQAQLLASYRASFDVSGFSQIDPIIVRPLRAAAGHDDDDEPLLIILSGNHRHFFLSSEFGSEYEITVVMLPEKDHLSVEEDVFLVNFENERVQFREACTMSQSFADKFHLLLDSPFATKLVAPTTTLFSDFGTEIKAGGLFQNRKKLPTLSPFLIFSLEGFGCLRRKLSISSEEDIRAVFNHTVAKVLHLWKPIPETASWHRVPAPTRKRANSARTWVPFLHGKSWLEFYQRFNSYLTTFSGNSLADLLAGFVEILPQFLDAMKENALLGFDASLLNPNYLNEPYFAHCFNNNIGKFNPNAGTSSSSDPPQQQQQEVSSTSPSSSVPPQQQQEEEASSTSTSSEPPQQQQEEESSTSSEPPQQQQPEEEASSTSTLSEPPQQQQQEEEASSTSSEPPQQQQQEEATSTSSSSSSSGPPPPPQQQREEATSGSSTFVIRRRRRSDDQEESAIVDDDNDNADPNPRQQKKQRSSASRQSSASSSSSSSSSDDDDDDDNPENQIVFTEASGPGSTIDLHDFMLGLTESMIEGFLKAKPPVVDGEYFSHPQFVKFGLWLAKNIAMQPNNCEKFFEYINHSQMKTHPANCKNLYCKHFI